MRSLFLCISSLIFSALAYPAAAQSIPQSNMFAKVEAPSFCAITPPEQACVAVMGPIKLDALIVLKERKTGSITFVNTLNGVDDFNLGAGTYDTQLLWHSAMRDYMSTSYTLTPQTIEVDRLPNGNLSSFLVKFQIARKAKMEKSIPPVHALTGGDAVSTQGIK